MCSHSSKDLMLLSFSSQNNSLNQRLKTETKTKTKRKKTRKSENKIVYIGCFHRIRTHPIIEKKFDFRSNR